jgi:hypothetical protein
MAIKRFLLPLVGTEGTEALATCAFQVARAHQAQVRALVLEQRPFGVEFGDRAGSADLLHDLLAEAREEKAQALAALAARYQPLDLDVTVEGGETGGTVAHAARLSDIAVIGAGARYGEEGWGEVRDAALFQSGRPVLLVPRMGVEASAFDRVVVAWKESIESARAVAAAQPFLRQAREVHLVTAGESDAAVASLEEVETYLQLHYAETRSETIPHRPGEDVAEILLEKRRRSAARCW